MVIFNFVLFCGVRGVSVSTDAVTLDAAVDIIGKNMAEQHVKTLF